MFTPPEPNHIFCGVEILDGALCAARAHLHDLRRREEMLVAPARPGHLPRLKAILCSRTAICAIAARRITMEAPGLEAIRTGIGNRPCFHTANGAVEFA